MMKKTKAILAILLAGALTTSMLSACGTSGNDTSDGDNGGKTTVTFWKAPHSDDEAKLWQPVFDKFAEEHPEINLEFLVTPWDTWNEQYSAAFAGGNPPDVSYMTEGFPNFVEAGQLEDLTPYITDELKNKYSQDLWDSGYYKDTMARVPFLCLTSVVFYNKDLFEAENIEIPENWDELLDAAKKLTKDTDGDGKTDQWGFFLNEFQAGLNIHQVLPFVIQNGATLLNEDATALGFNNEAGIEGLKYITDFIVTDKVAPGLDDYTLEEATQLFYNGQVGMYAEQCQYGNNIKTNAPDLNFGVFPMPAGSNSNEAMARANYGGYGGLSMAADSKVKDEAWTFIEFVTLEENGATYLKANNMLDASPEVSEKMWGDDEVMAVAAAEIPSIYAYPTDPRWFNQIDPVLKDMLEEILRGAKDVETAVADADEQVKQILAQ
jgi:ABC-type glycerol-3-phosphate transport system substrate-binding protein